MTKKNIVVVALIFLAVAGFYFYMFRDSFRRANIQIVHTFRPKRSALFSRTPNNGDEPLLNNITFALGHDYQLTSVKVISVGELQTNKYPHPLWELTTESNSVPTRAFFYGGHIKGLHPAVKGATATPLESDVTYRLLVEAGSLKGQHDFTIREDNHTQQ